MDALRISSGVLLLTACLLAGCAPSGGPPRPAGLESENAGLTTPFAARGIPHGAGPRAKESDAVLYVSDEANHTVYGFVQSDPSGKPFVKLADVVSPFGLYVDSAHNLWVADAGRRAIAVYAKGQRTAKRVLNDLGGPYDVTICPNGTIFAAGGNIVAYQRDAREPSRVLTDPQITFLFVTCDAANNVVADGVLGGQAAVDVFAGGQQSGLQRLPISLNVAGGVEAVPGGKFLVADPFASGSAAVTEYDEAGHPTGRAMHAACCFPLGIGLTKNQKQLFTANWQNDTAEAFSWPGGQHIASYVIPGVNPEAWGVAVDPPELSFGP